jgi:hypothetical protein
MYIITMLCTAAAECNWTAHQMLEVYMTSTEHHLNFRILFSHLEKY